MFAVKCNHSGIEYTSKMNFTNNSTLTLSFPNKIRNTNTHTHTHTHTLTHIHTHTHTRARTYMYIYSHTQSTVKHEIFAYFEDCHKIAKIRCMEIFLSHYSKRKEMAIPKNNMKRRST